MGPFGPYSGDVPSPDIPRSAGAQAIASWRRTLEERLADLIRRDPERAASAAEVGLVDRSWLERPGEHPVRTASSLEVVQRFLERSIEQKPSVLATMGLSTIQLLASNTADERGEGSSVSPVAVMFTDLEGFTRFTSDHGDDAALALLEDHHRAVGPVVRSRGGRVVKRLGDGLMLAFVSPEAAALAAVELVALRPEPLCLRAGMHLGEAVLTRDDVVGHVVNVAARVTEAARGGQALATVAVRDAAGELPGVRFARARRMRLRGVPDPVLVCRVEAEPNDR